MRTSGLLSGAQLAETKVRNGCGRWRDNVFVERLWRTIKYERVYLTGQVRELAAGVHFR